ncbi:MAG TPA: DUF1840 domain-containing protein [Burkholderiaceae bacterium]
MYRFQSKAGGDVLMLGENGQQVLAHLGREPAAQGLIQVVQLPAAMAALEQAVAQDEAAFAEQIEQARAEGKPAPRRPGVQLKQRVWPLLELMRLSVKEEADLTWSAR